MHLYSFLGQANISILYTWAETCYTFYLFSWKALAECEECMVNMEVGGLELFLFIKRAGKFCQAKLTRVSTNISFDCALQARATTRMKLPACFQPSVVAASSQLSPNAVCRHADSDGQNFLRPPHDAPVGRREERGNLNVLCSVRAPVRCLLCVQLRRNSP